MTTRIADGEKAVFQKMKRMSDDYGREPGPGVSREVRSPQSILSSAPDGMLIAPAWKRVVAFATDVVLIVLVIELLTQGLFLASISNYALAMEGGRTSIFTLVNWFIFFVSLFVLQIHRQKI